MIRNNLPVTMAKLGYRTYKDIARKSGLTETTISKLMNSSMCDEERIYFGTINAICKAFSIQITDIMEYVGDKDPD